ncbi:hypothetical protein CLV92_105243 [Kineococcus xinjiangensis]|uniref:Uncharacterized protein n=1 Tax=Kineococcus xinjiangensis TaxID=512762 RepID=A0A2S6IPP3_9ACTN|nr:hypothetical protein [Kineococcus xinjiangensis]PPK96141.1 hypothetical protein CLV92_105243 [Kineococcus xinjiangensis]
MSTPLNALHQPLNDFFLQRFRTPADSPVLFRFDRFGSTVDDDDFRDPSQPETYSPALACERISDLVNRIPVDTGDGMTIVLTPDALDTTYHDRILAPALPHLPQGSSEEDRAAIVATFSGIKAEARRLWEDLSLLSSTGMRLEFRPTEATPATWYEPDAGNWTAASFQVKGSGTARAAQEPELVWKLRPDLHELTQVLQLEPAAVGTVPVGDLLLSAHTRGLAETHPATAIHPAITATLATGELAVAPVADRAPVVALNPAVLAAPSRRHAAGPWPLRERAGAASGLAAGTAEVRAGAGDGPLGLRGAGIREELLDRQLLGGQEPVRRSGDEAGSLLSGRTLRERLRLLPVRDRLLIKRVLDDVTPAAEVTTPSLDVSFEYCLVNLRRPWCSTSLLHDRSWRIPGHSRGDLTAPGAPGNLPLMPVGFVAVRKLRISAAWSEADRSRLGAATSLGPFEVGPVDASGALSRDGMQIVGWLLQPLPPLPPQP